MVDKDNSKLYEQLSALADGELSASEMDELMRDLSGLEGKPKRLLCRMVYLSRDCKCSFSFCGFFSKRECCD